LNLKRNARSSHLKEGALHTLTAILETKKSHRVLDIVAG
jgi:hypothetical protein